MFDGRDAYSAPAMVYYCTVGFPVIFIIILDLF